MGEPNAVFRPVEGTAAVRATVGDSVVTDSSVSWIAANGSLRYFFVIAFDLLELTIGNQNPQL